MSLHPNISVNGRIRHHHSTKLLQGFNVALGFANIFPRCLKKVCENPEALNTTFALELPTSVGVEQWR